MQRAVRILGISCRDVCEAFARIVNQQQVDAFTLKLVVVVQPLGVDDGHIALTVLGDDLLCTSFYLVGSSDRFALACDSGITSLAEMDMNGSFKFCTKYCTSYALYCEREKQNPMAPCRVYRLFG